MIFYFSNLANFLVLLSCGCAWMPRLLEVGCTAAISLDSFYVVRGKLGIAYLISAGKIMYDFYNDATKKLFLVEKYL